jgi:hypothetical protein
MSGCLDLRVIGDDAPAEVASLRRWLRADSSARGIEVRLDTRPAPGQMGVAGDVLQAVVQPDGLAVALITAVVTWLSTRNRRVRVEVRTGETQVVLEAAKPEDAQRLAESVVAELRRQRAAEVES